MNVVHSQQGMDHSFLEHWTEFYGLNAATKQCLLQTNIKSGKKILRLTQQDILALNIPLGQKCLLRGAIFQYKKCRQDVDSTIQAQMDACSGIVGEA